MIKCRGTKKDIPIKRTHNGLFTEDYMNQEKINKINDSEFELLYNSLFATPVSISGNKANNKKYVTFIMNHLITGDEKKMQSVELDKEFMSTTLQERKKKMLELMLLTSKNTNLLFKNANVATTDIRENIKYAVNFPTKFVVMTQFMYSNLKPEIKMEMMKNFADSVKVMHDQKLISDSAVNFATEHMMNVDSRFKSMMDKNNIEEVTLNV